MKKFILGYHVAGDSDLTEYTNKQQAEANSEEWAEVEANSLEEAKAKYEETHDKWQKSQQQSKPFDRDLLTAFKQNSFPVNPRPFANAINAGCETHGTDWIKSDEAKALLLILMQQAHGQLATIDLIAEWQRLNKIF